MKKLGNIRFLFISVVLLLFLNLIGGCSSGGNCNGFFGSVKPEPSVTPTTPEPRFSFSAAAVDLFDSNNPWVTDNKLVTARNTGNQGAFVRILIFPTIVSKDGYPLPAKIGDEILIPDLNTTNWMFGDDSKYYYLDVLKEGETAPWLFQNVQLSDAVKTNPDYAECNLKIDIVMEAIAAKPGWTDAWWSMPPASGPELTIMNTLNSKL